MTRAVAGTKTALTILRPPLVYGPGGRGNFHRLARLARSGLPLPFASIRNRRSLIFAGNLAHFIDRSLTAPAGLYHVADGPPISTPDWIARAATAQGTTARLFPVPAALIRTCLGAVGLETTARRLCDDLALTIDRANAILGPAPIAMDDGFRLSLAP